MCDKTCIFFFFPVINKYFLMAKRSLLSRCPSYYVMFLLVKLCTLLRFTFRRFIQCFPLAPVLVALSHTKSSSSGHLWAVFPHRFNLPYYIEGSRSADLKLLSRSRTFLKYFLQHDEAVSISIIVQQDVTIYSSLYFCKLLYMFRVIPSPIIRSTCKL